MFREGNKRHRMCGCPPPFGKVTGAFWVLSKALQNLQGFLTVTVQFYRLVESKQAVGELAPHTVLVTALSPEAAPICIWPPPRRAAPRYPPRPRARDDDGPAALMDVADEAEDQEVAEIASATDQESDGGEDAAIDEMDDLSLMLEELIDEPSPAMPGSPAQLDVEAPAPSSAAPSDAPADAESPGPPVQVEIRERSVRGGATVILQVPGGSIGFYPSKQAFEAVCEQPGHGRCVLTRTKQGRRIGGSASLCGGRPVGFLAAWLAAGEGCPSKAAHWEATAIERPLAERAALRAQIAACGPSGRTLLDCERPQEPGEPAEPESLEGLYRGPR